MLRCPILIVEDDAQIVDLIKSLLCGKIDSDVSFRCHCVPYFEMAMALLESDRIAYSVIVYDPGLPDMSGMKGVETICAKAAEKDIPVIVMTGDPTEIERVKGMSLEVESYVRKPFDAFLFKDLVETAARRYDAHQLARQKVVLTSIPQVKQEWSKKRWAAIIGTVLTGGWALVKALIAWFEARGKSK
jgi:DNA-binding response OmpR family regulator